MGVPSPGVPSPGVPSPMIYEVVRTIAWVCWRTPTRAKFDYDVDADLVGACQIGGFGQEVVQFLQRPELLLPDCSTRTGHGLHSGPKGLFQQKWESGVFSPSPSLHIGNFSTLSVFFLYVLGVEEKRHFRHLGRQISAISG
jgi:hypothetical protein